MLTGVVTMDLRRLITRESSTAPVKRTNSLLQRLTPRRNTTGQNLVTMGLSNVVVASLKLLLSIDSMHSHGIDGAILSHISSFYPADGRRRDIIENAHFWSLYIPLARDTSRLALLHTNIPTALDQTSLLNPNESTDIPQSTTNRI